MYSEKKFKNYIFWIQVKRVVLIIFLSIIGAAIGIGIGAILKGTIGITTYNNLIIIILTVAFFSFSVLITSSTGKEVQDGYWKIAVLRKLTAIQKTLETNNELVLKNGALEKDVIRKMNLENIDTPEIKAKKKNKKNKTIKKPELVD